MKYKLHMISHTHWDREWYLTFQEFRIQLVKMIDKLLDILDNDPEYKFFMLDGQAVVLEDYLAIRPENIDRLKRHILSGRVLVGPWYVLPDLFLVSGEALIRNLMLGMEKAEKFGRVMMVGYMPDQFGFISQMPQILKGVGIDTAVIWRGINGNPEELKSEFYWQSPDGSQVLTIHLPDKYGYYSAANLPSTEKEAYEMIIGIKDHLIPYATTRHLLLMNGVDHMFPQSNLPRILNGVNRKLKDSRVIHSTLPNLIRDIRREQSLLKVKKGEFRETKTVDILRGTISTRMYLKQENEKIQTLLENWAEPWCSFAWLSGREYPDSFLKEAWRLLLQNHPHDSICGCSTDEVHQEMLTRFLQSQQIAEEFIIESLSFIARNIGLDNQNKKGSFLTVFNPLNWERAELITTQVSFPHQDKVTNFELFDEGNKIPYHLDKSEERVIIQDKSADQFPIFKTIDRYTITFLAKNIPSCGYKTYSIVPIAGEQIKSQVQHQRKSNVAENQFFKLEIHNDGTFDLIDKENNFTYKRLHYFEDSGDAGDEYNYCWPKEDKIITSLGEKANIRLLKTGEDFTTYQIDYNIKVPVSLTVDRKGRSHRKKALIITSYITLAKNLRRIDIVTELDNKVKDHRLRVLFPTGIKADYSYAEGQFDVVKRPIKLPDGKGWFEQPTPTHPKQNFVDVSDDKKGLMIANKGLTEYEVKDDDKRTIAITLLRGVEWGARGDLLNTMRGKSQDGKAENNPEFMYTPEAQCLGRHTYYYSIIPHKGNWQDSLAYQHAYQHKVGIRVTQIDKGSGGLPLSGSFLAIYPSGLIITAIKKCEKRKSLIVRLFNPQTKKVKVRMGFIRPIKMVRLVNLREEPIKESKILMKGKSGYFQMGKKKIQTIEVVI